MRILLAVDGSNSANHAVETLVQHISWFRETPNVDVVFAHLPVRPVGTMHGVAVSDQALERYYEQDAEEMLAQSKRLLLNAGVAHKTHLLIGEPADVICRFAEENHCDMIFMGTRGMSMLANLFLGSTANKVLHLAHVPVVLVPMEHAVSKPMQLGPTMRT